MCTIVLHIHRNINENKDYKIEGGLTQSKNLKTEYLKALVLNTVSSKEEKQLRYELKLNWLQIILPKILVITLQILLHLIGFKKIFIIIDEGC